MAQFPRIGPLMSPYVGLLEPEEQASLRRNALLHASLGMLEASGPSRTPVSFGQALARGAQQGLGAADQYARGAIEAGEVKEKRGERAGKRAFVAGLKPGMTMAEIGGLAQQQPGTEDIAIGAFMPPKPENVKVAPGESIYNTGTKEFTAGPQQRPAVPAGYRVDAAGNLEYIPGGPADPSVVAAQRAPVQDPSVLREYQQAVKEGLIPPTMTLPQYLGAKAGAVAGGRAEAETRVEATNMLPAARITRDTAVGLIDFMLDDKNAPVIERMTGAIEGLRPTLAARSVVDQPLQDMRNKLEQLTGTAWLTARDQLKGGGPISNQEAARAEVAKARLQTTSSAPEFKKALREFRDALVRGFAALEAQSGSRQPAPDIDVLLRKYAQ